MPLDLSQILVIGVSSRSLFNLETENAIFEKEGIKGYRQYQLEHENEMLEPGTAFHLIQSLLHLNEKANKRIVESSQIVCFLVKLKDKKERQVGNFCLS